MSKKYVVAVDQSTSGTKASLLDRNLETVRTARKPHEQFYPKPGYAEHDAEEIWQNTAALLKEVTEGIDPEEIVGLGIANQRETTVLWDRATGKPVHKAIVWQDVRAGEIAARLEPEKERITYLTGLVPSPYYSAAKAAHVLKEDPQLMERARNGEICFGTVDSYLLYRLTGGKSFATDLTNASRTQLLDIHACRWSEELAKDFDIPFCCLPDKVLPCDSDFGVVETIDTLKGVHITSMMGDSHASLYGHGCIKAGMVKTSYGTGSSIMMNIGHEPVLSNNGLSTSIGYAAEGQVHYVLEGNITCSADTLVWVRDSLELIHSMDELDAAGTVESTDGVYLVPAFSGLGAPWFDEKAKAIIYGMNRGTTKAHVLRAALASIAHQNADVLDAMSKDTGVPVTHLKADGGGSVNKLLMQMQSDYTPCAVAVSAEKELTQRGVAIMAGQRFGFFESEAFSPVAAVYEPKMAEEERLKERAGWADALARTR